VWIAPEDEMARKVCAIGMRVSKRATMHGFALNCDNDLSWVDNVIPCGIDDAEVTTLSREAGRRIAVADVCDLTEQALTELVSERTRRRAGWPPRARAGSIDFQDRGMLGGMRVTIAPEGRRLLRVEQRNAEVPFERK